MIEYGLFEHPPVEKPLPAKEHGAIALHTYDPAIAIQLGALGDDAGARLRAFDATWAGLSDAERARARAIHLGARPDHVTVAFATD